MADWPNLFIAGAPRCGTSSLHAWLHGIPGIYMSRIKEPNFFSRQVIADDHPRIKPIRDEAAYLQLFAHAGGARYRGEASPSYLQDPGAPAMIRERVPDARIIVSLRDPVERLHSTYLMLRNNRTDLDSFPAEIERGLALQADASLSLLRPRTGLYADQVQRYRSVFGESQFRIVVFEEMMADVPGTLRSLLDFLGLNHTLDGFDEPAQRRHGEARGPLVRFLFGNRTVSRAAESLIPYGLRKWIRNTFLVKKAPKQAMDPEARNFLVGYYRDDVARLEASLGRRMPWRNFAVDADSRSVT